MIAELRRRAYLSAMQVVSWLPRFDLPNAAPSRDEVLHAVPDELPVEAEQPYVAPVRPEPVKVAEQPAVAARPSAAARVLTKPEPAPVVEAPSAEPEVVPEPQLPPPRFSLQLLRAGDCLLLVELPTGEPFQSRDPAYILLKDMLRAAGLPDSPQLLGEPVRWPLMRRSNLNQGPDAACEFVHSFVASRLEAQPPSCLWLVGLPALRFAAQADEQRYNQELEVEGLGACWALPSLELLIDEPVRKRAVWQAMRRVRQRWISAVSG